eukprot:g77711.t1
MLKGGSECRSTAVRRRGKRRARQRQWPCSQAKERNVELSADVTVMTCKSLRATHLLPAGNPFSWQTITRRPKEISSVAVVSPSQQATEYHMLHTGGFARIATDPCRSYWCLQNSLSHTTPDWKIHFSCHMSDRAVAWNALVPIFLAYQGIGMKMCYMEPHQWSEEQRGRELTVYVYCPHPAFFSLAPELDIPLEHLTSMQCIEGGRWLHFVREAESALARAGVRSRGIAHGDLPIGTHGYASLRNEAFVRVSKEHLHTSEHVEYIYPPNSCGWNAANHTPPFALVRLLCLNALGHFGAEGRRAAWQTKIGCCSNRQQRSLLFLVPTAVLLLLLLLVLCFIHHSK